jgi:Ion channel
VLEKLGYRHVRHYIGGMADWLASGGLVERGSALTEMSRARPSVGRNVARHLSWLEILANWPLERLIGFWLGMIIVFGVVYWLAGISMGWGLQAGNTEVKPDLSGLATAIYFSFVTALSIGYGDVIPLGVVRILAVIEGIAGLLIFGCVISKLVSRRQEELTEEIHRTTFEDRLDRVRTNLHLVFSDLGAVQQLQAEQAALPDQVLRRLESTVRVFCGELQTIHDLLYRSHVEPDEETLESLLANLVICLQSLVEIGDSRPTGNGQSATLDAGLRSISNLAKEICGECVPRVYAPALKESMDQIQELARRIA